LDVETTCTCCGAQRPHVDAQFSRELIERLQLRVARQINDRPSRALQNRGRN
jgi:hypothetical protein